MDTIPESRIQIVPMTAPMVEAVAALEHDCFSNPWSLDLLAEELSNPMAVFRIAVLDDKVAGYIGMHHIIDEGYITNVAVAPVHRCKGIATALVKTLLAYGKENDLRMVTLEVRPTNAAAISLYKALDFVEVGSRKNYYTSPTEDALLMTCEL